MVREDSSKRITSTRESTCLKALVEVSKLEVEMALSDLNDPFAFLPKSDDESDDNNTSVLSISFDFSKELVDRISLENVCF